MSDIFLHELTDTWNGATTEFRAIYMKVTDAASAAGSLLMGFEVNGNLRYTVDKLGNMVLAGDVGAVGGTFSGPVSAASMTLASALPIASGGTGGKTATEAKEALGIRADLDLKANLDSPTMTGTPRVPTFSAATNSTVAASTGFVNLHVNAAKQASPTDTVTGKLLTPGAFGLGSATPPATSNANTLPVSGEYSVQGTWTGSPFAGENGSNYGVVSHYSWTTTYATQVFRPANFGPLLYRQKVDSTWSAWDTLATLAQVNGRIASTEKAAANGVATLDATGKVPLSQISDSLIGNVSFQGSWNANTNSPAIPAASAANKGHYRIVATAGATNINGITDWKVGDWIISTGAAWEKVDNTDQVMSVAGRMGAVVLTSADMTDGGTTGRSLFQDETPADARTHLGLGTLAVKSSVATADLGSNVVTTAKIATSAVTFNELQNIATQTLIGRIAAGTGNAVALTVSDILALLGFSANLVQNGILRLPLGFIMQWGVTTASGGDVQITYPTAMPNFTRFAIATLDLQGNVAPATDAHIASVRSVTRTGFIINRRSVSGSAGAAVAAASEPADWLAIGH